MNVNLVITFMGKDQPGLVESIAAVIAEEGGSWLESRMCHLSPQFAGVLRVLIKSENEAGLTERLLKLKDSGLSITIESAPHDDSAQERSTASIQVVGNDRVGIVSEIAQALASQKVNIEDLHTELTTAPMSGDPIFTLNGQVSLPEGLSTEDVRRKVEAVADDLNTEVE